MRIHYLKTQPKYNLHASHLILRRSERTTLVAVVLYAFRSRSKCPIHTQQQKRELVIKNDSIGDTMDNNGNAYGTVGDVIGSELNTTLLVQLQNDPSLAYCQFVESANPAQRTMIEEQTRSRILRHRSEFPLKLRDKIEAATTFSDLPPTLICEQLKNCLKDPLLCKPLPMILSDMEESFTVWNILNNEVDTEEEVELTTRLFPSVLEAKVWDSFPVGYDRMNPVFGVSTYIKAFPFVALLTELMIELGVWDWPTLKNSKYYDAVLSPEVLVTNEVLIYHRWHESDEEFYPQLDDISLSVMTR